jgi:ATP-dependent DNA helicase RecG
MSYSFFETPIEYLKGVGPQRADILKKELNIFKFEDLLYFYPFRYVDRSKFQKVNEVVSDSVYVQIKGKIRDVKVIGKYRAMRMTAVLEDETGKIELIWFQGIKWLKDKFKPDVEYVVFGKPSFFNNKLNIAHPETETVISHQSIVISSTLQPFYNSTEKLKSKGLDSRGIGKIMRNLMVSAQGSIPEVLSEDIIRPLKLIAREEALINIHFPQNQQLLDRALLRLKFEELFFTQLRLLKLKVIRNQKVKGHVFSKVGEHLNSFYKDYLPFELTNAQKRVIKEIRADIGSGRQMNRLLQGDVGSGKTLVGLMAMLIALDNNYQACLMAPTEILANQHYETICRMLNSPQSTDHRKKSGIRNEESGIHTPNPSIRNNNLNINELMNSQSSVQEGNIKEDGLNVNVRLLTGSTKAQLRKKINEELLTGELDILIGTHALIEETVQFDNLGLVVIDEQHRFGVEQRASMWKKNIIPPHVLVMTATPIPRTLAMTLYGDLDVSVIDELPPGRKPVITLHLYDSKRMRLFGFMKEQIKAGRQIYIVYPLINESETLDLKHLMDGYESISREFPLPNYSVSIVHGQQKTADREYEMQRFIKGKTNIMVATTVIEVGVDIPNASVMVIESAQRFGLSQLHQLRGRVGRAGDQSYCILMTDFKLSAEAKKRIETMVRTTDGFEIAEVDLRLRGPGDLEGTQQSGVIDLKLSNLAKDEKILTYARKVASELLDEDPNLMKDKNKRILDYMKSIYKNKTEWGQIS